MDVDKILTEIGECGRYQIFIVSLLSIPLIISAVIGLNYIFTALPVEQRCYIPECEEDKKTFEQPWLNNAIPVDDNRLAPCERYAPVNHGNATLEDACPAEWFDGMDRIECNKFVFKPPESTIGTEWYITCDKQYKLPLVGTLRNVGQIFGNPVMGYVADRIGRRGALVLCVLMSCTMGIVKSFSYGYSMFVIFEMLDAIFASGIFTCGYILGCELVGPKWRDVTGAIFSATYAVGEVLLGLIAMAFKNWKRLLWAVYIPPLLLVSYLWLLPESIRWLIAEGRQEEAKAILRKAAKCNGSVLDENLLTAVQTSLTEQPAVGSFLDAVRSRRLRVRLVICGYSWFTCSFVYFGLAMNSVSIGANPYSEFIFVSFIEIPAIVVTFFLMTRVGRKVMMTISLVCTGLFCGCYIFVPSDMLTLRLVMFLGGKFAITVAFTVLFLYTAEMFPTPQRSILLGVCIMFSRIAATVAPMSTFLQKFGDYIPLLIFGITALVAAVTTLFLPETRNMKLPDTVQEAENIGRTQSATAT